LVGLNIQEHLHIHTRQQAGLFDVSRMGQIRVSGNTAEQCLESLLPIDLSTLAINQQLEAGVTRTKVGLRSQERAPVHDGCQLYSVAGDLMVKLAAGLIHRSLRWPLAWPCCPLNSLNPAPKSWPKCVVANVDGRD
jgi:Aminomethyltransferase folate-binding domain